MILKSLIIGFKRRWRRGASVALSVLGFFWLIAEVITRSSALADAWVDDNGGAFFRYAVIVSFMGFMAAIWETRRVSVKLPPTNSNLSLGYGDIFEKKTDLMIGVNDMFDTAIGLNVSAESLHGKVVSQLFNGDSHRFGVEVSNALQGIQADPSGRYPIGTVAVLILGPFKLYLVAISNTDVATGKAHSSVSLLWDALQCAFAKVEIESNGRPFSMPLMGNGRASLNLRPQHILRLLTLALVESARSKHLPDVHIVLPEACFESLDLVEIQRDWGS